MGAEQSRSSDLEEVRLPTASIPIYFPDYFSIQIVALCGPSVVTLKIERAV